MAASKQAGDDIAIGDSAIGESPSELGLSDLVARRRRMRYRAWHRGTKEMDLVLGPFADAHIEMLPVGELDRLEALMNEEDTDLLKWVMGQEIPPAGIDIEFLDRLIAYRTRLAAAQ